MLKNNYITKKNSKQRLTAFVDPVIIKRAKVRGALEGLTISEVVEKALESYTPKIENGRNQDIRLKFIGSPAIDTLISEPGGEGQKKVAKHTMPLVVPK